MCGVAGAMAFAKGGRVDARLVTRMADAMVHRGPDGSGHWVAPDGRVGLAHRRLAIIDLSDAARQPMGLRDRELWIAYNGEIYNHRELRRELDADGEIRWQTDHSDTEVILRAYERWGIACLDRLHGPFAFALWDGAREELWLVRDRIGVKPLYFSLHHGRIHFASEIKALLANPNQPRRIQEQAFVDYLSFLVTPAPDTLFEGIHKLRPGHRLRVRPNGALHDECWYDLLERVRPRPEATPAQRSNQVLHVLAASCELSQAGRCSGRDFSVGRRRLHDKRRIVRKR